MESKLIIEPIGVIKSLKNLKFDAPHQPDKTADESSEIELFDGYDYERALEDIQGFDYIWLIWWFHKNKNWKARVMPPRGKQQRRGVFSTRSPHRPNPIGISVVKLLSVNGRKLVIGANDLIDETPILDIKPYIVSADSFPTAKQGWIGEVEKELAEAVPFNIKYSIKAEIQLAWLKAKEVNFIERAESLLRIDPYPHRTRRISKSGKDKGELFRMISGAWRIYYSIKEQDVLIEFFEPGYPISYLTSPRYEKVPYRDQQLEFYEKLLGEK